MTTKRQPLLEEFTVRERHAIARYLDRMIEFSEAGAKSMRQAAPPSKRPKFVVRQLDYYENLSKGFRWARGLLNADGKLPKKTKPRRKEAANG